MGTQPEDDPPEEGDSKKLTGDTLAVFERSFKRNEKALRALAKL